MTFFIKEWPNKTATLMSDSGTVLWTFSSVHEAKEVWQEWSKHHHYVFDESLESNQDLSASSCYIG